MKLLLGSYFLKTLLSGKHIFHRVPFSDFVENYFQLRVVWTSMEFSPYENQVLMFLKELQSLIHA